MDCLGPRLKGSGLRGSGLRGSGLRGSGLRGSGLFLHPNSLKVGALRNLIYKFLRVCTPAPENKQVASKKPIEIKKYFQEHARKHMCALNHKPYITPL